ncbi:hypothetical protein ACQ4WX_29790 [Streptomyces lasalocidi]
MPSTSSSGCAPRSTPAVPEEDYATTLDVLRRMIRNLGGQAELYP